MLALLAMARCAVLRGVVMTKSGSMLSGERCDLRKDPCGRWKVQSAVHNGFQMQLQT